LADGKRSWIDRRRTFADGKRSPSDSLGHSADGKKVLVEAAAVLFRSAADLLQFAHDLLQFVQDPLQSAEALGDVQEDLFLFATVLCRQEKDLCGWKKVLVRFAQARGRRKKVVVGSAAALFHSAEDLGESAEDQSRQKKVGSKKTKSLLQPSTSEDALSIVESRPPGARCAAPRGRRVLAPRLTLTPI
jgi:hypothetical protein